LHVHGPHLLGRIRLLMGALGSFDITSETDL
jgi:hypothetical protein